jgi:ABC-type transport system involved in multi-copper enzyme maturation permease subunit
MYLWKYWRDTRRGVFVYLGVLIWIVLFWMYAIYRANRLHNIGGDPLILWAMMVGVTFSFVYLCAIVMGLILGTSNVGADFAKGTAEFLLTRSRSRRYFVWTGWLTGMAELLSLMIVTGFIVVGATAFATGPVWRRVPSPIRFQVDQDFIDIPKMVLAAVLMAALVFGLTYFMSVLLKSSQRGVIASLGILTAYQAVNVILKDWARISLPSLDLMERAYASETWHLSPQVVMLFWAVLALAFPFAAQVALDRKDI